MLHWKARSVVSESVGRTRDGPGARDCRVFVDTSTQQIVLQSCFFLEETLIQTQQGTTAAENHQDTSIDLCSCNYGPFLREIGHQQMLISQQLLYRDSLEFPSEREEAITRPPRARHNPDNQESCEPCARTCRGSRHAQAARNPWKRIRALQQGEYANS